MDGYHKRSLRSEWIRTIKVMIKLSSPCRLHSSSDFYQQIYWNKPTNALLLGPSQTLLLFRTWRSGPSKLLCLKNLAVGHLVKYIKQFWEVHQEWKYLTAKSEGHVCSSKKDELLLWKFLVVRCSPFKFDNVFIQLFYSCAATWR